MVTFDSSELRSEHIFYGKFNGKVVFSSELMSVLNEVTPPQ